jgi:hypothetical protein
VKPKKLTEFCKTVAAGQHMLREIQTAFAASLFADDTAAASRIRAGKLSAARRLEIYRHNVYANLCGVLTDIYPVIRAVVGEAFFRHAAEQFVAAHPSRSGDLNQFGSEWGNFLDAYPHASDLPYLPDVARLEWAWHQVFHAGDTPPFDLAQLAAIPAEEHGALRFMLHPSVRLMRSAFPVLRIWEVNQPAFTGEVKVDWDVPPEQLLVHRDATDGVSVMIERIPGAAHAFLCSIQDGASLEAATSAVLGVDAAFDLQGFLLESVQSGVIIDFVRKTP